MTLPQIKCHVKVFYRFIDCTYNFEWNNNNIIGLTTRQDTVYKNSNFFLSTYLPN